MATKDHACVIHISELDKIIYDLDVEKEYLAHHEDESSPVASPKKFRSMLRHYFGEDWYKIRDKRQNELNNRKH